MSDRLNLNLQNVRRQEDTEPQPGVIKRRAVWEIAGFAAALAAFALVIVFGSWQWATLLMLFAIYCAAMR